MTADAMCFHTPLQDAEAAPGKPHQHPRDRRYPAGNRHHCEDRWRSAALLDTYRGDDLAGNATVPLVGACRADVSMDSPLLRRIPDKHGNLQRNRATLDKLEGILTAKPVSGSPGLSRPVWICPN